MPKPDALIAITHVAVVSMVDDQIAQDQTVLIQGERIVSIAPADRAPPPEGARVIDGAGKYLIPGLFDMHVHIVPHIALPREGLDAVETSIDLAGQYLGLFLSHGVTTVRNMAGSAFLVKVKQAAEAGRYPAPRISLSGPILEERFSWSGIATYALEISSPEAAVETVRRHVERGYDCVKIYNHISAPVFEAVMATARDLGLMVCGHVPLPVGLAAAMEAGQDSIEHFRGFDEWLDTRPLDQRTPPAHAGDNYAGWRHTTARRIGELADLAAQHDTWHVPTMMVENPEGSEVVYPPSVMNTVPWTVCQHLEGLKNVIPFTPEMRADVREVQASRREMLLELDKRGVKLMAASDCPGARAMLIPGHSLLLEVASYVSAGLSPYRALRTATVNPARYLGLQDQVGTLEVGKVADMVLLDSDPLADISALFRQAAVFARGRPFETGARGSSDVFAWTDQPQAMVARTTPKNPLRRGFM